ncbi:MAG TPA: amino acid adenylation domain-containing protein [Pyrinomonadaceae bacterium]
MGTDNIESIYRLSPMQQGILYHTLYAPRSGAYIVQVGYVLDGPLNVPVLRSVWQKVLDRHPALRTFFVWERLNESVQVVRKHVELPWEHYDWQALSSSEQTLQLQAFLQEDRERGFDLNRAPLMRITLITEASDRYQFVLSFHHLLLDGWSLAVLMKEVLVCYKAICSGVDVSLTAVRPYEDYIKWLRQQDLSLAERYWRKTLKGFISPTPLGVDRTQQNSADQADAYAEQSIRLSIGTIRELEALAQREHLTLNTLVQGGWALVLRCYSGENDVLFGTTVSGRPVDLEGVEAMVGLFINTLPVRIQMPPTARLLDWLRELQAQQVEARQYEYSPLVEIHGWSEVPRGQPLFESIVVFENYPQGESLNDEDGGLRFSNAHSIERTNYPLNLVIAPGTPWFVKISYNCRRFDAATVNRMLGHFQTALERMVADPDQHLSELSLLTATERHEVLDHWNDTSEYFDDVSILQALESQAERRPDALAVVFEDQQLTYSELNRRSNQLARHLRALGVRPEILVGLCIERSVEMIIALFGILKAGGAYVPLDPTYPEARLAFMMADAQVSVLVTSSQSATALPKTSVSTVCLDTDWAESIVNESADNLSSSATADNLAYVIYTSGSTGQPKGTMIKHGGLSNMTAALTSVFDLRPDSNVLQFSSLSFDASVLEIFGTIRAGARLHLLSQDDLLPGSMLTRLLRDQAITCIVIPPSILAQLPAEPLPELETIIVAGEACPVDLVSRWASGRRFFNAYGPTEGTVCATLTTCSEDTAQISIGRPIANTQIYLLSTDLHPMPIGVAGEMYIGGIGLARGYLNRPALTAKQFIPDSFSKKPGARLYSTGDLARYLPDGNLDYLGRVDHQVKVRGYRIELGEIEAVLSQHPAVRQSAVLAKTDANGNNRLVAYVVSKSAPVPTADLRAFLKEHLPVYMVPAIFVWAEGLPLTPNGKVDHRALPPPDELRSESTEPFVAPRTVAEHTIVAIWTDVLAVNKVGAHDNFFDLGGHSLLLVQLKSKLEEAFHRDVSLVDMTRYPTVSALAKYLSGALDPLPFQESHARGIARRASMREERQLRQERRETKASKGSHDG